jgi:glycosyltransferase involved in cell wall biosynthesis
LRNGFAGSHGWRLSRRGGARQRSLRHDKDCYNGFKVAEGTGNWAETVANLSNDGQRLSVLSENSLAFAEDYSVEKMTKKISRFYRRLIVLHQSENG